MRRAAKRDQVEAEIVDALLRVGCQVERLTSPVDLLVRHRQRVYLLECKTPGAYPDARQKAQAAFCKLWEVPYVRTVDQALAAVGAIKGSVSAGDHLP